MALSQLLEHFPAIKVHEFSEFINLLEEKKSEIVTLKPIIVPLEGSQTIYRMGLQGKRAYEGLFKATKPHSRKITFQERYLKSNKGDAFQTMYGPLDVSGSNTDRYTALVGMASKLQRIKVRISQIDIQFPDCGDNMDWNDMQTYNNFYEEARKHGVDIEEVIIQTNS